MKKQRILVAAVLFIVLLLAACRASEKTVASPSDASLPEQAEMVSNGVALPSGKLPDEAFNTLEPPARYYPEPTFEIIPSPDYGRVWPYIGGWTDSKMGTMTELFGVCDEAGKVVCDPVYNDVKLIEHDGNKMYAFTKNSMLTDGEHYGDKYMTTLAGIDASWVETYDSVLWEERSGTELATVIDEYGFSGGFSWREPVSYDYITAQRGGGWGVLDWNGSVLLQFEYLEPVCFYEGLASVLSEDGKTVSFIDITGETVLGPYQAPPEQHQEYNYSGVGLPVTNKLMFHEGLARFYENGKYGMINREGEIVISAAYDFVTSLNNGTAMLVTGMGGDWDDRRYSVINDAGRVIVEPSNKYPFNIKGEVVFDAYEPGKGEKVAYDGTRSPYVDYRPYVFESKFVFRGGVVEFPTDGYYMEYINDDMVLMVNRDTGTSRLYDYDGEPVSPEIPGRLSGISYYGQKTEYLLIDASKPGQWTWPPPVRIYGLDGSPLLEGVYKNVILIEDKFMVRDVRTAGLKDKDGNYIIEVSVMAYGID